MKKVDMEKIVTAVKNLIEPREKDDTHLDSHVQINKLFGLLQEELLIIRKEIKILSEKIDKNNDKHEQEMKKIESIKESINTIISWEMRKIKEHVSMKVQKDSFIMRYEWIVSTDSQIDYELEPITPKFSDPYRMEIQRIRKSSGNDNVLVVKLPWVEVFEWSMIPIVQLKSKWWKAIYEYDFDVLVTKL